MIHLKKIQIQYRSHTELCKPLEIRNEEKVLIDDPPKTDRIQTRSQTAKDKNAQRKTVTENL